MASVVPLIIAPPRHLKGSVEERKQAPVNVITRDDVTVKVLGKCLLPSPVASHLGEHAMHFVGEADKVLLDDTLSHIQAYGGSLETLPAFELAGPRNRIF